MCLWPQPPAPGGVQTARSNSRGAARGPSISGRRQGFPFCSKSCHRDGEGFTRRAPHVQGAINPPGRLAGAAEERLGDSAGLSAGPGPAPGVPSAPNQRRRAAPRSPGLAAHASGAGLVTGSVTVLHLLTSSERCPEPPTPGRKTLRGLVQPDPGLRGAGRSRLMLVGGGTDRCSAALSDRGSTAGLSGGAGFNRELPTAQQHTPGTGASGRRHCSCRWWKLRRPSVHPAGLDRGLGWEWTPSPVPHVHTGVGAS